MKRYGYLSGPYGFKAAKAVRKGPIASAPKAVGAKRGVRYVGPSVIGVRSKSGGADGEMYLAKEAALADLTSKIRFDTEETVERNMQMRRGLKKTYFKAKARTLFNLSEDINTQLASIQTGMASNLSDWIIQLDSAEALLEALVDELEDLHKGPNAVFNWIISFAGSLGASSIGSAREDSRRAVDEATEALEDVRAKIRAIKQYKNKLTWRQQLTQLRAWKGGTDLIGMIDNVSRSFGIDQRDMLQGWWDQEYLDDRFAIGDKRPWQPVCDLYQSLIVPRSWESIFRWMDGPPDHSAPVGMPSGFSGYGETTAGGTVSGDKYVYFRQPRPGEVGHRNVISTATPRADPWGKSLLQDGCVPGEPCPVGAFTVPSSRTRSLIGIQEYGLELVTSGDIRALLDSVDDQLDRATTAIQDVKDSYSALDSLVDTLGYAIRPQIQAALEATGGPTALDGALFAAGWTVGGPIGGLLGWLAGELVIAAAVNELYDLLTDDVGVAKAKARLISGAPMIMAKTRAENAFWHWDDNTTASWRLTQANKMHAVREDLLDWMDKWDAMEPVCRQIYPVRSASEWIRLGVPQPCMERAPEFEMPGGWTPPADEDLDPMPDEPLEVLTPYGAVAPENTKTYAGLTLKTWMFIGGIATALIFLERRWQDQEWT